MRMLKEKAGILRRKLKVEPMSLKHYMLAEHPKHDCGGAWKGEQKQPV